MAKLCRFELRTTDADAARAFYGSILGHERSVIWPLHEQALARGARPHWLGQIGVEGSDFDRVADAFVARGATRLGPTLLRADGSQTAVLRDPGGRRGCRGHAPARERERGRRRGMACAQYERCPARNGKLPRALWLGVQRGISIWGLRGPSTLSLGPQAASP